MIDENNAAPGLSGIKFRPGIFRQVTPQDYFCYGRNYAKHYGGIHESACLFSQCLSKVASLDIKLLSSQKQNATLWPRPLTYPAGVR
jgi:hypothetical protein